MNLTTAPDVLLVIVVMFAAGTAASHLLFRKSPMARAIARVGILILLTIALLYAGIVPYQPLQPTGVPWHDAAQAVLRIAWWLWMAWFLVGFLRAFVIVERRPREGKLLQDLLAGLIYLAALFAIVSYVFDLPIRGLLATSGVIAIILGEAWLFGSVSLVKYALVVLVLFHLFVVLYEEPILESQFAESYRVYRRAVPRWGFTTRPFQESTGSTA